MLLKLSQRHVIEPRLPFPRRILLSRSGGARGWWRFFFLRGLLRDFWFWNGGLWRFLVLFLLWLRRDYHFLLWWWFVVYEQVVLLIPRDLFQ